MCDWKYMRVIFVKKWEKTTKLNDNKYIIFIVKCFYLYIFNLYYFNNKWMEWWLIFYININIYILISYFIFIYHHLFFININPLFIFIVVVFFFYIFDYNFVHDKPKILWNNNSFMFIFTTTTSCKKLLYGMMIAW